MQMKIFGRGGGLFCEGASRCRGKADLLTLVLNRPYLHIYMHSNELEEVSVISLDGVNVESNQEMEALLGVSGLSRSCYLHNSHDV